jgi:hypothetical protein
VVLQNPEYLNPVAIGSSGGIDLAVSTGTASFGALIVANTTATNPFGGFGFIAPGGSGYNGYTIGTGAEYGPQAISDAIVVGGNSQSGGTATYQGISSSFASTQTGAAIGYLNNAVNGPGTTIYSTWRGVDLTSSGPTGGADVTLISPTYVGDASLRGYVDQDDYIAWNTGNSAGESSWQAGNFLYEPTTTQDSYIAWNTINSAFLDQTFPGFGTVSASPVQPSFSSVTAVPEPATVALLLSGAIVLLGFFWKRRVTAS